MSERRDTSGPGQALEFEIWSDLIKQSKGALHVFLPLLDRGLDAVLHRLTDGQYIPRPRRVLGSLQHASGPQPLATVSRATREPCRPDSRNVSDRGSRATG